MVLSRSAPEAMWLWQSRDQGRDGGAGVVSDGNNGAPCRRRCPSNVGLKTRMARKPLEPKQRVMPAHIGVSRVSLAKTSAGGNYFPPEERVRREGHFGASRSFFGLGVPSGL
jgi:hypothetical protein